MTSEQNGEGVQEIAKFADKQYIFCRHREGVVKKNNFVGIHIWKPPCRYACSESPTTSAVLSCGKLLPADAVIAYELDTVCGSLKLLILVQVGTTLVGMERKECWAFLLI